MRILSFLIVIKKKVGFSVVSSESSQLLQHHIQ